MLCVGEVVVGGRAPASPMVTVWGVVGGVSCLTERGVVT